MNNIPDAFLAWAEDPSRTLEERYGILRLTEHVYHNHYQGPDKPPYPDYQAEARRREARKYNPAYDPHPEPGVLRAVAGLLHKVRDFSLHDYYQERPLRDLSFLAYLPQLENLQVDASEVQHLEDLRHLTELRKCAIDTNDVEDFTPLASCRKLTNLKIHTRHPWPQLSGFEDLPLLEELEWTGNAQALASIPILPALKKLHIHSQHWKNDPENSLRDVHQLPEMPQLDFMIAGSFYRLDGIGRYPRLRYLIIKGYFKNLEAIKALPLVSHLRVISPRLENVSALLEMPSVLHFAVHSEGPQDWSVLVENETLREVYHYGHDLPQPELETLRVVLTPWDSLFAASPPRPLPPLRMWRGSEERRSPQRRWYASFPEGPDGWDGHAGMRASEAIWAGRLIRKALREAGFLGLKGVRLDVEKISEHHLFSFVYLSCSSCRSLTLRLLRTEAIGLLRPIVECLRGALARTRFGWSITVMMEPEPDATDWDDYPRRRRKGTTAAELEEEQRDYEYQRKRRQTFLKDIYRFRLLQDSGQNPGDFHPSPMPEYPESPAGSDDDSDDEDEEAEADDDDDDDREPLKDTDQPRNTGKSDKEKNTFPGEDPDNGGTATAEPNTPQMDETWFPPPAISDPNFLWNDLCTFLTVTEFGVHVMHRSTGVELLAQLLDLTLETGPDPLDDVC